MDRKYGFISVDDHVTEHPDVWTRRLDKSRWGDRIPHIERRPDGAERWCVDGQEVPLPGVASTGAAMSDRVNEPQHWDDVPKIAADPAERLKAMDVDGVDYSVLYPTVAGVAGETFGRISDHSLELACVQAYNDWLIEEWSAASDRFVPQCILPLAPIDAAVTELRRSVARGHRGLVYPATPMMIRDVPHINEPDYDPIWAACQELDVPVCFHAGASRAIQFPAYEGFSPGLAAAMEAITRPASSVLVVANFLYSRVLTRYPGLRVVFAESSLAWGAYELELADHQFERQRLHSEGYDLMPSELFRRQCFYTGWFDHTGIDTRKYIGVDNILWSSNFPLATSSWPESREVIDRCFAGVPDAERDQMLWGNAAKLYGI
jgi:predicted TIM-barrel fold metal-dependent hydrolase